MKQSLGRVSIQGMGMQVLHTLFLLSGRGLDAPDDMGPRSPPQQRQQEQEQKAQLPYDRRIDQFQSFRSFQQSSPNTGSMSGDADSRIYPIWYRKLWPQLQSGEVLGPALRCPVACNSAVCAELHVMYLAGVMFHRYAQTLIKPVIICCLLSLINMLPLCCC